MKWILHRENRCQELLKRTSSSKRGASFRTRFLNFFLFFSMSIYSREDTFSLFSLSLSLDFLNVTCNNILFFLRWFYVFLFLVIDRFCSFCDTMWCFFLFFFCALIMELMCITVPFLGRNDEKYCADCVTSFEMLRTEPFRFCRISKKFG